MATQARRMIERAVLALLVRELNVSGWRPTAINDGDGWKNFRGTIALESKVMGLDDCLLNFAKGKKRQHWVKLVRGNDGVDMISDWGYSEGDPDGFNATMGRVLKLIDAASVRFVVTHKMRLAHGLKP